jgi:glycosyltransferase involved in cell wall biosynthesis
MAATGCSDLRLLVLCAGDPEGARPFSGSARSLFQALARQGAVHHKANVYGMTDPFARGSLPVRLLRRIDRFGVEEAYRWTGLAFDRNSRRAEQIAAAHPGFNACLMYGTNYNPGLGVPTYCYFDATAAQVWAARAWEFGGFSAAKAARIIGYQQRVFDRCACVFPRTRWAAHSCLHDYGLLPERIEVVGAGPNYYAEPLPHGPYDQQRILFIGSEFDRKGGPLVLEAFRRVRAVLPGATLRIVGCSPAIDEAGVEVVGRIEKDTPGGLERLLHIYREASVFCMMSHFEPFGIVVIEAQNCGVPCVLPNRFAFPEMVRDGETGCLVQEYDAHQLTETLTALLRDPARLEAMGAAGHAFVRGEYTWDAAAARMLARIRRDLVE